MPRRHIAKRTNAQRYELVGQSWKEMDRPEFHESNDCRRLSITPLKRLLRSYRSRFWATHPNRTLAIAWRGVIVTQGRSAGLTSSDKIFPRLNIPSHRLNPYHAYRESIETYGTYQMRPLCSKWLLERSPSTATRRCSCEIRFRPTWNKVAFQSRRDLTW